MSDRASGLGSLVYLCEKFFTKPSVHLIGQEEEAWKWGKTDLGLLLAQICEFYGYVDLVATNINTYGHYFQITDIETLKAWLHKDDKDKLFVFDEANIHAPNRRAMSNKSVKLIMILPEVSKAHARMIVIGQKLDKLDTEFRDTTHWVRSVWLKRGLKTVHIFSPLIEGFTEINDLPKTTVPFDPYEPAPFTEHPSKDIVLRDEDLNKYSMYLEGIKYRELGFKHPQEFGRWRRKIGKRLMDFYLSHITLIDERT